MTRKEIEMSQDILGSVIRALVSVPTELLGMMKDFIHKITGKDSELWISQAKLFLQQKQCWAKPMSENRFLDWLKTYQILGMEFQPGKLEVPEDPNFWDVYVMNGVTLNMVVVAFRKLGVKVSSYLVDLDEGVQTNDRDPKNGSYRIRFKANFDSDPEHANKSANDLKEENVQGITLLERLLLELAYFLANRGELDIESITLCSGSRDSNDNVLSVYWGTGYRELCVSWRSSQSRYSGLRARAVVS